MFWGLFFAGHTQLCDKIFLEEGDLRLNANEKVLVCGSDKSPEAWKQIPVAQSEFHLKALLASRGYLNPRFERRGDELWVWSGELTKIKRFEVLEADPQLKPQKKRKILEAPLISAKLDEAKSWAEQGLKTKGYACPEVEVTGQAWDGTLLVRTNTGPKQTIASFSPGDLDGLHESAIDRYRAFEIGEEFDIREPEITSKRLVGDDLFQSAYITQTCEGSKVHLALHSSIGKPRVLHFGIGASTEEFPFVEAWLRNVRLDEQASSFRLGTRASPRIQTLSLTSELYWIRGWPRAFLGPRAQLRHESERAYELNKAETGLDLGRSWDFSKIRARAQGGPTLNYLKTLRGTGPADITYLTWEASMTMMSHIYEYTLREQEEGWTFSGFYKGQRRGLGSEINVDRYDLTSKFLWNLGDFSPPLFVLVSKFEVSFVDAQDAGSGNSRDLIPTETRIFFGGEQNLRGFQRKILDNRSQGYLTAAYAGFELRLIEQLPSHLQPFLLWDWARLGNRRRELDPPLYTSEGGGLRWASPFGTLRGSAARGRIFSADSVSRTYPQEWVYFLSFGQEF